jgi:carbon-monoxide dehydrogenase medium subunit
LILARHRYDYVRADHLDEALEVLAQRGSDVKVLAGGQSLVPLLHARIEQPAAVVDINRIKSLGEIRRNNGTVQIGALVRQLTLERDAETIGGWPLLGEMLNQMAHVQIRTRGTVGGSLAQADPAGELPAAALVLGAQLKIASAQGERTVSADEFFVGQHQTVLQPNELLVEVTLPQLAARTGTAFRKIAPRFGDFATVGVATAVTLDQKGAIRSARIALMAVGPTPIRPRAAEAMLEGQAPTDELLTEAGRIASQDLEPASDPRASGGYRKEMCGVLVHRMLAAAAERAAQQ